MISSDYFDEDFLEVNDLCAGYLDMEEYWYRARVVDKSLANRTYHLSILDFLLIIFKIISF